jgi:hypothetical protein
MSHSGNKPSSTASTYHKYNTRYRKPHPYNTRYNGMSCSVLSDTFSRAETTASSMNYNKRQAKNCRMDSIPSTPSSSSSHSLLSKERYAVQPTPSPDNASCFTPKQSNCAKHHSPILHMLKNPYRPVPIPVTAHKPAVSLVIDNPYSVQHSASSKVPILQGECFGSHHSDAPSLLPPPPTPKQRRELSSAEKARIASNKA